MNIISATFGSDTTEITWVEEHEDTPQVKIVRLALIRNSVAPEALAEVQDLLKTIVDEGQIQVRLAQGASDVSGG